MKNQRILLVILCIAGLSLAIYGIKKYIEIGEKENNQTKKEEQNNDNTLSEAELVELLTNYHEKMQTGDSLNGYSLSIRLIGFYDNGSEAYNNGDVITIENYMDKKYRISESNTKTSKEIDLYMTNDSVYIYNENEEKYEKVNQKPVCNNPLIFMESLKTGKKVTVEAKSMLDNKEYKKYTYIAKKDIVNEMLDNTTSKDLEVKDDVEAVIFINPNGYIHSIEYNLGRLLSSDTTLTLQVYYYGINSAIDYGFDNNLDKESSKLAKKHVYNIT